MPKPNHGPRKPMDDEDDDDVMMKNPSAAADWMDDEDADPMEDTSLEVDEEEEMI